MNVKVGMREWNEAWKTWNASEHSAAIFAYAQRWADAMEHAIENGAALADVWESLSLKVAGDITGNMHNAAVAFLVTYWKYGDDLKQFDTHDEVGIGADPEEW